MGELSLRRAGLIDWGIAPAVGRGYTSAACASRRWPESFTLGSVLRAGSRHILREPVEHGLRATLELQVAVERGRGPPKGPHSNISSPAIMKQVPASAAAYPFLPA